MFSSAWANLDGFCFICKRLKFNSWHFLVEGDRKDIHLRSWEDEASQKRQYWFRSTHGLSQYEAKCINKYIKGLKLHSPGQCAQSVEGFTPQLCLGNTVVGNFINLYSDLYITLIVSVTLCLIRKRPSETQAFATWLQACIVTKTIQYNYVQHNELAWRAFVCSFHNQTRMNGSIEEKKRKSSCFLQPSVVLYWQRDRTKIIPGVIPLKSEEKLFLGWTGRYLQIIASGSFPSNSWHLCLHRELWRKDVQPPKR